MRICEQCGAPTQPEEAFCGACGTYLEWQEPAHEAASPVAAAEPAEPAVPAAAPPGVPRAGGGAEHDPGTHGAERPAAPGPVPGGQDRAAPVRPGAAAARPHRREAALEDRRPLPGETICPDCGAGNVPTRRFCRRCGADLVDAPAVPDPPWYRRLFRRAPRPQPVAGSRPTRRGRRGLDRRAGMVLLLLLVLAAGGWVGRGRVQDGVDLVRDRIAVDHVNATAFTASSAARGHPAEAVGDAAPNRYWSPRRTGAATGEFVTLRLEAPVRLAYVKIFNGPSSEPGEAFLATARLRTVQLTMTQADGGAETRRIDLKDAAGGQDVHVGVDDVVSLRVTVVRAYGADRSHRVALGEVELFRRS